MKEEFAKKKKKTDVILAVLLIFGGLLFLIPATENKTGLVVLIVLTSLYSLVLISLLVFSVYYGKKIKSLLSTQEKEEVSIRNKKEGIVLSLFLGMLLFVGAFIFFIVSFNNQDKISIPRNVCLSISIVSLSISFVFLLLFVNYNKRMK